MKRKSFKVVLLEKQTGRRPQVMNYSGLVTGGGGGGPGSTQAGKQAPTETEVPVSS